MTGSSMSGYRHGAASGGAEFFYPKSCASQTMTITFVFAALAVALLATPATRAEEMRPVLSKNFGWLRAEVLMNSTGLYEIGLYPHRYQENAHEYKWNSESWTIGSPNVEAALLLPAGLTLTPLSASFSGREVIHGQRPAGAWRTFEGKYGGQVFRSITVSQVLGKAIEQLGRSAGVALSMASAAEAIAGLGKQREMLRQFTTKEYKTAEIPLPKPDRSFCAAKIGFGLNGRANAGGHIGILLKLDKKTWLRQYKATYVLLEVPGPTRTANRPYVNSGVRPPRAYVDSTPNTITPIRSGSSSASDLVRQWKVLFPKDIGSGTPDQIAQVQLLQRRIVAAGGAAVPALTYLLDDKIGRETPLYVHGAMELLVEIGDRSCVSALIGVCRRWRSYPPGYFYVLPEHLVKLRAKEALPALRTTLREIENSDFAGTREEIVLWRISKAQAVSEIRSGIRRLERLR